MGLSKLSNQHGFQSVQAQFSQFKFRFFSGTPHLFNKTPNRNLHPLDMEVSACLKEGNPRGALQVLEKASLSGLKPTQIMVSCALNACGLLANMKMGEKLHCYSVKTGFELMGSLGSALVDMYAKNGEMGLAHKAFSELCERDGATWNSMLSGYSHSGSFEETAKIFELMNQEGVAPNQFTFAIVLSACAKSRELNQGKKVHSIVIKLGFESYKFCVGSLIGMYAKCGSILDGRVVFDGSVEPDIVSWTAMIAGYLQVGSVQEALELFLGMQEQGLKPDQVALVTILSACVKYGWLKEASKLFKQMREPGVVAWNAMISGHAQNGFELDALQIFGEMKLSGIKPTRSTLGSILSACANLSGLEQGLQIHSEAIKLGLDLNFYVGSALVNMYSKCGFVKEAKLCFETSGERNIVLWNAMLSSYVQNEYHLEGVRLFASMVALGFRPDEFTFGSILSACGNLGFLELGLQLHAIIIKSNIESNIFTANAIVDFYAKCGKLVEAFLQFEVIPFRDTVSWNAIIVGHAQVGYEEEALAFFHRMNLDKASPDEVSLASVLSACANIRALCEGLQLHGFCIKLGYESNLYTVSALIDMYAKCGFMECANKILIYMPESNVVSRNAIISGWVQNDNPEEAINAFKRLQVEGIKPTQFTFASILVACSDLLSLDKGKQVHGYTFKSGFLSDSFLGSSVLDMYAKCQATMDAYKLFHEIRDRSTVLWTSMISGHAQSGLNEEALDMFREMMGDMDAKPDQATFSSVLRACSSLAALSFGKTIHGLITRTGFSSDVFTGSSLIDFYTKCGAIEEARRVFEEMKVKDLVSWNAMLVGYAKNGYAHEALNLFARMEHDGMMPDRVTYLGVLTACSHGGMVSKGRELFNCMAMKHGIMPRYDHYACIVDLLGRAGQLQEAEDFINKLPFEPDSVIWFTLLSACRVHKDNLMGKRVAERLIDLEPQNSSTYVLLSNIYAATDNWDGVNLVRREMRERGVRKSPGCSWIEVGNNTHSFVAGDRYHPQSGEIYAVLETLVEWLRDNGYVTMFELVLNEEDPCFEGMEHSCFGEERDESEGSEKVAWM
ncbi:pentatricopeptide repeat-containing protein At3g09040, mitochondrial [Amborella trichopoda]|uniref:pentatricopeptide repeat-containing protein At3g09040, mitochondrial n=1 Tax=Amborella trichopoda TaxID=13333 RepID=UPI0005D40565|nr:pentatricopeptide repeat-containing protein At3g09040, mitochondrial [Amborella trichopoda]|eukprot:XP_011623537.1 pentatricopeptide repeat-containing protein At3g09040, mitochondrial [Amborella trichopoda]